MPKASSNPTQRPRKRPSQTAPEHSAGRDRFERVLAVLVVVFAIIAVAGFASTLMHIAFRDGNEFFAGIAWQYAYWLPLVALPSMIGCLVVLVLTTARGKSRSR